MSLPPSPLSRSHTFVAPRESRRKGGRSEILISLARRSSFARLPRLRPRPLLGVTKEKFRDASSSQGVAIIPITRDWIGMAREDEIISATPRSLHASRERARGKRYQWLFIPRRGPGFSRREFSVMLGCGKVKRVIGVLCPASYFDKK